MKDIVIIGAGGFGREVEWLIERINQKEKQWNFIGFVDDSIKIGTPIGNSKVIYNTEDLKSCKNLCVAIAIGNTKTREHIYNIISENENLEYPNLIDPSVITGKFDIGYGNIICAGTIITVNVKFGNLNIINLDCTVGHDDILHDYITLYPSVNVSGNVEINSYVEIGTGTQIIQGKSITKNAIIGAGAVVVKNIEEEGTYVGIPVKKIN